MRSDGEMRQFTGEYSSTHQQRSRVLAHGWVGPASWGPEAERVGGWRHQRLAGGPPIMCDLSLACEPVSLGCHCGLASGGEQENKDMTSVNSNHGCIVIHIVACSLFKSSRRVSLVNLSHRLRCDET